MAYGKCLFAWALQKKKKKKKKLNNNIFLFYAQKMNYLTSFCSINSKIN